MFIKAFLRLLEMRNKGTGPNIRFHFLKAYFTLHNRTCLKGFIAELFKKERTRCISLNYIFCSDAYLLKINREYLNHDFYTDIITFNLSDTKEIEGEIYISIDRVRDNTKQLQT